MHEKSDLDNPNKFHALNALEALLTSASLSLAIGSAAIERTLSEIIRIIQIPNAGNRARIQLKLKLTDYLIQKRKKLQRRGLSESLEVCKAEYQRQSSISDFHVAIDFIKLSRHIEKCLEVKSLDWEYELGRCYEMLAAAATDPNNLAKISFLEDAILHYKKSGDTSKVESLIALLSNEQQNTRFGVVSSELDLSEALKESERIACTVCGRGMEFIIRYLMFSRELIPNYEELEKMAESQGSLFPLQAIIPSTILDSAGNTIQHFSSEDEKKYFSVLQTCGMALDTTYFVLLRAILFRAIQVGKLEFGSLSQYLSEKSWLGKKRKLKIGNEIEEYRWLDQILPALYEYFANMVVHFKQPDYRPSLMLSVDSLAVKIEGMVRDICRLSGVNTKNVKEDRLGRTTSVERDLHSLLYDPAVSALFDRSDLLFLRFLLVEQAGYCIRHKVAHSLMRVEDYRLKILHYLILAVLRIGRYDVKVKEK